MNFNKYQEATRRTAPNEPNDAQRIHNYVYGLGGESGEVQDLLKKHMFHGHVLDVEELEKELGDVLWYLARLADEFEIDLNNVAANNIKKLKKRYPNGFSEQDSLNREE